MSFEIKIFTEADRVDKALVEAAINASGKYYEDVSDYLEDDGMVAVGHEFYIVMIDGKPFRIERGHMEPEDATLGRDLGRYIALAEFAYVLGVGHGKRVANGIIIHGEE